MQLPLEQNDAVRLKHSKLGIMAFAILLSPIIPLTNVFVFKWRILLIIFDFEQILLISNFFTSWCILAPILAFVLSIIDLKKPERRNFTKDYFNSFQYFYWDWDYCCDYEYNFGLKAFILMN